MQQLILIPLTALLAVAVLVTLTITAIGVAAAVSRARMRRSARPTGSLVEAAGTTLHAIRRGPATGPTIAFIAGVGGVGAVWSGIQDRLGETVGSIAYDRAGLGWSGPARGPRTAAAMADELHDLLARLDVPEPCILVGHSLGGAIARNLAARHPERVAGLVLVDSAHEEQYTRIPEMERVFRRMTSMPGAAIRLMGALAALRIRTPLDPRLPVDAAEAVRTATIVSPTHLPTAMAEMGAIALASQPVADLGDLPLVVLRHGRYERMPMLDTSLNDRFEALFAELQTELAALSTRGRVVVADDAGHDIHLERPDLVVEAIAEVLSMASLSATDRDPDACRAA